MEVEPLQMNLLFWKKNSLHDCCGKGEVNRRLPKEILSVVRYRRLPSGHLMEK
jgi:hypothetical protein